MKSTMRHLGRLSLLGLILFSTDVLAQDVVQETTTATTTTTTGTISEFGPDTMYVKTTTSVDPVRYGYTKTTTYVDEDGKPVSIETVKSGLPVTVYYDTSGNKMVATKVIVKKTVITPAH